MKNILSKYRQFYAIPKEFSDKFVLSHLIVFVVFLFTLGFAVSQVIIFLIGK